MKRTLLLVLALLTVAADLQAVTVFEGLSEDNFTQIIQTNCGSSFYYMPGYVNAYVRRKNVADSVAAYYVPLGSAGIAAGTAVSSMPEFWFQFDYKYTGGTGGYMNSVGLFSSTSDNVSTTNRNNIGVSLGGGSVQSFTNYNTSAGAIGNTAQTAIAGVPSLPDGTPADVTYRTKLHAWVDASGNLVGVTEHYQYVGASLVLMGTSTGTLVPAGNTFAVGMDAIGIRNGTGSWTKGGAYQNIDNIYFSTDGAMTNVVYPDWMEVPEPATMLLLGLGGLLFTRKR